MNLKIKSLKHIAMAGIFGAFLLLGMSATANAQYRQDRRSNDSHHQKHEKQELKHHQKHEREYYGNSRQLRRHQKQERRQVKRHQRNERNNNYDPYYNNRRRY
jgi:hypothetical protein